MFSNFEVKSQKYLDKYIKLVSTDDNCEYVEVHHKLPRCMGGLDDENNLVKLSARKHFLAHFMLWKAFKTSQLAGAFLMMTVSTKSMHRESKINSRLYEKLKEIDKAASSARTSNLVWVTNNVETKYVPSEKVDEYLDIGWKRGRHQKLNDGITSIIKDGIPKRINKEELQMFLDDGWKLGTINKGKISVIKDGINLYIDKSLINEYLDKGYVLGGSNKGLKIIHKDGTTIRVPAVEMESYLADGWIKGHPTVPNIGRTWINNGSINKSVLPNELEDWLGKGFKRGRK